MEKIMIDSVKTVPGKAGKGDLYIITSGGNEYLCFQGKIVEEVGKEVEGEMGTSKSGKTTFKMAGVPFSSPGKPFSGGGGRSFGRSPDDLALTAKTMSASYAKDLCVAFREADLSFNRVLEMFSQAYDTVYAKVSGDPTTPPVGYHKQEPDPLFIKYQDPHYAERHKALTPQKEEPKVLEEPAPPPAKTDRNEVTCGGANAKLKGKKVSDKFCKVCSFRDRCEVRTAPAPLADKAEKTTSKPSAKSSAQEPASSAPLDQKKDEPKVPVAFIMKTVSEQKRVGKQAFHDMIATFNVRSASEIKEPDLQEAFLGCLATLEDSK